MSLSQVRTGMPGRDTQLRRYVDRHSGFVVGVSLGFAIASCLGLVLLFGIYATLGGDDGIVITLGLGLWLGFNTWAVRRFMAFLRGRASAEIGNQRFERFKPLQPTS